MTQICVHPSVLSGNITPPPSKSQTLRAIWLASLAEGTSHLHHPLYSPDTSAMIHAMRALGAKIDERDNGLHITGFGGIPKPPQAHPDIDCGNSGLVLRFTLATAALSHHTVTCRGDDSLTRRRWIQPLLEALQQGGATIEHLGETDHPPLRLRGPIRAGNFSLDGQDSQNLSALLVALALTEGTSTITVNRPGEKPYVRMTLDWLDRLGVTVDGDRLICSHFALNSRETRPWHGFDATIARDFSQATYPAAAAVLCGQKVTLEHLNWQDPQADRAFFDHLTTMGVTHTRSRLEQPHPLDNPTDSSLTLTGPQQLRGLTCNLNDTIDTLPLMAVLACYADSPSTLSHLAIARHKECDRITTTLDNLRHLGADITVISANDTSLLIQPQRLKGGCVVDAQGDHRMVMAMTVAALAAQQPVWIRGIDCVRKTYPHYIAEMQRLGATIETTS